MIRLCSLVLQCDALGITRSPLLAPGITEIFQTICLVKIALEVLIQQLLGEPLWLTGLLNFTSVDLVLEEKFFSPWIKRHSSYFPFIQHL